MAKASILIIEDSFIVAYHLQATLEGEGYAILNKLDSGESAISFIEHTRPDLVLMDIMLAGPMDGIETASIIKSRFNIPVIYITALTDKNTISRAKITEPYGYLTKPFEDREIFTVIEMALYKHDIESRLKQSEEKYFSTVNSISDAVITVDRECNITFMNPTAISLSQWTLHDALGKPVMEVLKLKNEITKEESINPVQCLVGRGNQNRMPDDLILVGRKGMQVPVGESSLGPQLNSRGAFIGLIIVFKDMTEKREHERVLRDLQRQRMTALIEGQETERSRIAKDLHDGLGQMLNAIKMNARMISVDNQAANDLSNLLDEAILESVRISENLLPSKLKDFDIAVCLRSLCTTVEKSTPLRISFQARGCSFEMDQLEKVNFYRITQEALSNVIKHAKATAVNVNLLQEGEIIHLSIEDNGKGVSEDNRNSIGKKGLVNMRDRAEIMGGKFIMESNNGSGTIVMVEVPVSKLKVHAEA